MKSDSILEAQPLTYVYAAVTDSSITWFPQSINGSRERYFISFTKTGELDRFYRE